MILGVALAQPATTTVSAVVAVRDGALLGVVSGAEPWEARAPSPGMADYLRRARAVCVAVDLDMVRPAPVAAIRVAGRCPPALRPLAGWPKGSGLATIVRGGHTLTGRQLARLDTAAVRRFAAGAGLTDFAVTASGSPVLADHELAVAEIIAAEVPGARITLSYEFGRAGLREREDDAIMNAALGPEAGRVADEVARAFPGLPLFFARSGNGLVASHYFRRYPLVCYAGATASEARGLAAMASLVPLPAPPEAATAERSQGAGPLRGPAEDAAARVQGLVADAVGWSRQEAGIAAEERPLDGLGFARGAARRGDGARGELVAPAAAFGAALAGPTAEVERIVQARGRAELDRVLDSARDEALARVVSAGAAPGSARIASTTVNPLSYLPDGLYRLRVTAEGATP